MSLHFSVRDIAYCPTVEGVRITVTTDVLCTLHCRLTTQEPWIHKKAVLRRGLRIVDDVRFCFTQYEDESQDDPGDTLEHTFWYSDWPVCTTKHFYFWATIGGVECISTSPIFHYHNDGHTPVPVRDLMYTINSIQPEKILGTGINAWINRNVQGIVSPQATGIVGIAVNADAGQERNFGIRKTGGVGFPTGSISRLGMTGFICGLDENLSFDLFVGTPTTVYLYVMGYTGRNVHFLDEAINLHPTLANVWQTRDTSPYAPGARACLWSCGTGGTMPGGWKLRVKGSADDWWNSGWHTYPALGVSVAGEVEVFVSVNGLTRNTTTLIGYIDNNFQMHEDAKDVTPPATGAWVRTNVADKVIRPPWVSLQFQESTGANLYGMRKSRTFFDEKRSSSGGDWMLVHADPDGFCDLWLPLAGRKFYLHGEIEAGIV